MNAESKLPVRFGRIAPCLGVRDMQAAYTFYVHVLGFTKVFENGNPVGFMVLKKDDAELHLSLEPGHRSSSRNAVHMFVDNVAALYAALEAAGVQIIKALRRQEYGQIAFVFSDPDGNRIDVGERTRQHQN